MCIRLTSRYQHDPLLLPCAARLERHEILPDKNLPGWIKETHDIALPYFRPCQPRDVVYADIDGKARNARHTIARGAIVPAMAHGVYKHVFGCGLGKSFEHLPGKEYTPGRLHRLAYK